MRGANCSLSGIENRCARMLAEGQPKEAVAKYCLTAVMNAIIGMTDALRETYGDPPLLYAGGVMSNGMMRREITARYENALFASPAFSCDNAAGVAVLAGLSSEETGEGTFYGNRIGQSGQ